MFKIKLTEDDYIYYITKRTKAHNFDNVARTKAYESFYFKYPDVSWALVASLVSRNAGWNMTDLHLSPYEHILSPIERSRLFLTYERTNWLIFLDAYPQLLTYQLSIQLQKPCFHLLKHFHVAQFMIDEWNYFWQTNDKQRLMTSLIINEQNVIQQPIINKDYYKYHIFFRLPYLLQNYLLMNAVILPTKTGHLYGRFVHDFTSLTERIMLGHDIASIIFTPHIYHHLLDFIKTIEPTGSRQEYEQYLTMKFTPHSPCLRLTYPTLSHKPIKRKDWSKQRRIKRKWRSGSLIKTDHEIGDAFYKKRHFLYAYYFVRKTFKGLK